MAENIGRTRMNLSQTAKGTWQAEVTSEYSTPEESAANLAKALDQVRDVAQQKGLQLVSVA